jgi:hypothetical protein
VGLVALAVFVVVVAVGPPLGAVVFGAFGASAVLVTFGAFAEEAFTDDGPVAFELFGAASDDPTTRATSAATPIVDFRSMSGVLPEG